jgi:hypothetical protein
MEVQKEIAILARHAMMATLERWYQVSEYQRSEIVRIMCFSREKNPGELRQPGPLSSRLISTGRNLKERMRLACVDKLSAWAYWQLRLGLTT